MAKFSSIDLDINEFMHLVLCYGASIAKLHECNLKNDLKSHELMRNIAVDNQQKIRVIVTQLFLNKEV